jgi:hypothetical protein
MFFPLLAVSRHRHCYDRFPANIRTPAQDEKRRATLAAAATISPSFSRSAREGEHSKERAAERDLMVLDIKVKLQGLWKRLINLSGAEDPLSSSEYGTIFALIESDVEGIGGSGLVECLREHIQSGWRCDLTDQQFMAVKELVSEILNLVHVVIHICHDIHSGVIVFTYCDAFLCNT